MIAKQDMFLRSVTRKSLAVGFVMLCCIVALVSCTRLDDRTKFNGRYYPAKGRKIDGDRSHFVVTVKRVNQGLDGARQAALQEANHYCVKNYGTSDIIWEASYDREVTQADVQNGQFLVQGKCVEW